MTGKETIEYLQKLSPDQVRQIRLEAGKGYGNAVNLWLCHHLLKKCESDPVKVEALANLLDMLVIDIEVV